MCIVNTTAEISGTYIFVGVRDLSGIMKEVDVVYDMSLRRKDMSQPTTMFLPIWNPFRTDGQPRVDFGTSVPKIFDRLKDVSRNFEGFKPLEVLKAENRPVTRSFNPSYPLAVHRVGDYLVSVVPDPMSVMRLDKWVFGGISGELEGLIKDHYSAHDVAFVAARLSPETKPHIGEETRTYEGVRFTYWVPTDREVRLPTHHAHHGGSHATALDLYDHEIWVAGAEIDLDALVMSQRTGGISVDLRTASANALNLQSLSPRTILFGHDAAGTWRSKHSRFDPIAGREEECFGSALSRAAEDFKDHNWLSRLFAEGGPASKSFQVLSVRGRFNNLDIPLRTIL